MLARTSPVLHSWLTIYHLVHHVRKFRIYDCPVVYSKLFKNSPIRRLSIFSDIILIQNSHHMVTEFLSQVKQSSHSIIKSRFRRWHVKFEDAFSLHIEIPNGWIIAHWCQLVFLAKAEVLLLLLKIIVESISETAKQKTHLSNRCIYFFPLCFFKGHAS